MENEITKTRNERIQDLSIQVGMLFSELYYASDSYNFQYDYALESYKYLRRLLPREDDCPNSRHIGATEAHRATQGELFSFI